MKKFIWLLLLYFCFIPSIVMGEAETQKIVLSDSNVIRSDMTGNESVISLSKQIPYNPFGIYLIKNINRYIHPMPVLFILILLITLVYTFLLKKIIDSYRTAKIDYSGNLPVLNTQTTLSFTRDEDYFEVKGESESFDLKFCDIPGLPDNILQEILIDTDNTIITQALFGTDKKTVAAIVKNLSDTSRVAVKDELKRIGKRPSNEEINEAKEVMLSKIFRGTKRRSLL